METPSKDDLTENSLYKTDDGRRILEENAEKFGQEPFRKPWRKDYARVLHCPAFRRLQGKTQLFPNNENDFFRNRLTHSLEVAQIAKSIAQKINFDNSGININPDIVEVAALAHDIGHPPFGHNGEKALDQCLEDHGGFEGNAQTFRILARLEKKHTLTRSEDGARISVKDGIDQRCGLNLTARTLAAILKYDYKIPVKKNGRTDPTKLAKGYYGCDQEIVQFVKESVLGVPFKEIPKDLKFKTIECQIMDIADDIAYSTYDLEDAFKAGFTNPLKMLSYDLDFYERVAAKIQKELEKEYPIDKYSKGDREFSAQDMLETIRNLFSIIFEINKEDDVIKIARDLSGSSDKLAKSGFLRTDFTSDLVGILIQGITFEYNKEWPALSRVYMQPEIFKVKETLKKFAYESLIMSPMLKLAEYRGIKIIHEIFDVLVKENSGLLLPDDYQALHASFTGEDHDTNRRRNIVDFISGMTDRYALEFYNRLFGTPESIHKPI